MKANREQLLRELKFVGNATEPFGGSVPILSHVLWRVSADGTIRLTTTDTQTVAESAVQATGAEEAALAIPAAGAMTMLSNLYGEEVSLKIADGSWFARDDRDSRVRLSGLPAEEFPLPREDSETAETVSVKSARFLAAVRAVSHAREAARAAKHFAPGVALKLEEPLTMAALSTARAAISGDLSALSNLDSVVAMPPYALDLLGELAEGGDELSLGLSESFWLARSGGRSLRIRRPEGAFPDLPDVVRKSRGEHRFIADREAFASAVAAAVACPGTKGGVIALGISASGVIVSARSDFGDVRVPVQAEVVGPDTKMFLTGGFLGDILGSVGEEKVEILYHADPMKPLLYERVDEKSGVGEYRLLAPRSG